MGSAKPPFGQTPHATRPSATGPTGPTGRPNLITGLAGSVSYADGTSGWHARELAEGVWVQASPDAQVAIANVGSADVPMFVIAPGPHAAALLAEQAQARAPGVRAPVVRQIAERMYSRGRQFQGEPEREGSDDLFDQDAREAEQASGIPLTFYGYDHMGAILIDTDGHRVRVGDGE
jgi:hypothetical protein